MCRIEERVYIGSDGRRQTFEDTFSCDRSHRGRLCSNVKRRTTEYFPKAPPISRDDASSPASNNPPTPTGTGSYLVEQRRPSGVERRPSTRDGQRSIKPEIVIEFGGSKKDKSKKYPLVSVSSTKSYKRSSLGAASVGSNEVAIESPGSDASYTLRTGFPEAPVAPTDHFGQAASYSTRTAVPQPQHRHTSSASSYTTSSQPPSLYATSEPESPSGRRTAARYPPTIVHNPPGVAPSSPTASRGTPASSGQYRTAVRAPQTSSRDNVGADGLTPLDYSDFVDRSASSNASSSRAAAPEITDRAADRERRRKHKEDEKRRQEEADRRFAEELHKEEEKKQVRFEIGRGEERARQRAEGKLAESEKRRAEEREDARQRKKDQEKRATKKPEREKKPPPASYENQRSGHTRRRSMTQADIEERDRLLLETKAQMAREREATEQRERDERAAELRQQQETSAYWDPRGGDRYPIPNSTSGMGRRNSISSRRGSISSTAPTGLSRTNSNRRVSVIQPAPPTLQTTYATRPSSSHQTTPQVFSPSYPTSSRPPSARHASSSYDNPFAQPPTRTSSTSHSSSDNPFAQPPTRNAHPVLDNPFAQPPSVLHSPPEAARDPWAHDLREALPRTNSHRDPRTMQSRGEEVINRSGDNRTRSHRRAQQLTQSMGEAMGYENVYDDNNSENEEDKLAGHGARLGRAGRRRN